MNVEVQSVGNAIQPYVHFLDKQIAPASIRRRSSAPAVTDTFDLVLPAYADE